MDITSQELPPGGKPRVGVKIVIATDDLASARAALP